MTVESWYHDSFAFGQQVCKINTPNHGYMHKFKIVDLFSGCGGFGLGAKLAGFDVSVAVDIDSTLQSAYQRNFPKTRVLNGDLSKMNADSWRMLLADEKIDGVIGGPPCQGYSRIGKNEPDDPRRSLLGHFFRSINIIQPKFFVMENVEGLLDNGNKVELDSALELLDDRYTVLPPQVIDAHDYGAPTKRRRVIVIGYDQNYLADIKLSDIVPNDIQKVNVRDAIFDIPSPIKQDSTLDNYGWAKYRSATQLSPYAKAMRTLPPEGLGYKPAIDKMKHGEISGNFDTIHSELVKSRYASVSPGQVDEVSRSKKLEWEGACPTLRAGTGSDKGSYQAVRPLHPSESRVITVREAARLQGFPDWFCFHQTKWHSFRMIGNSVSPIVSKYLLEVMKSKLEQKEISLIESTN